MSNTTINRVKYSRQATCVPKSIYNKTAAVIGCGAVGRNIIVQLTSMGLKSISIFDFDRVEDHNIVSQGFLISDLQEFKTDAIEKFCSNVNKDTKIVKNTAVWRPDSNHYDYVFLCADCMSVRANVSRYYNNRKKKPVLIDTRMRGEDIRILTCFNRDSRTHYKNNALFSNSDAADGNCTSVTTIYCAFHTASCAVQSMVNHMNRRTNPRDIIKNIGNGLILKQ